VPVSIRHPTEYNSTHVPRGTVHVENAARIRLTKNRFVGLSSACAINLVNDVHDSEVNGNFFHDLLGNAVNVGHPQHYKIGDGELYGADVEGLCTNNLISNNYIRNVCLDFRQVEGISAFFVADLQIVHNDVAGTPYGAIAMGWWWGNSNIPPSNVAKNNAISFNKAGDTHHALDDGGIIYTLGEQPDTRIEGNYLYHGPRCIYPDDGSAYLTIKRNVVKNRPGNLIWLHVWIDHCHDNLVQDNYVKNNLVMDNGTNTSIQNTRSFIKEDFPEEAQQIIKEAGIQDEFKYLIPEHEPRRVTIYPKTFIDKRHE
ncbi:MAG: right-handed parallel beta-helix repeat-containing protein, partial [Bacteroidota bacterium]